ncbi:hypothetical protein [Nocardia terpenica]|uniref:Uncharacterized protein n=1 Tax=Nocardia terpenica TaxID=455432 RepID=A0A6G9Z7W3_9NOCA|nr:hypothetical protein [Nocardia terpenica]QIS21256.1 hypothetical protein F6W96_25945 [Nocardia terpenica]
MRLGFHVHDIGTERLSWREFGVLLDYMPPQADFAFYRALHPNSWWWTSEIEFMAAQLHALHGANWQRSGGHGEKPTMIQRPTDHEPVKPPNPDAVPLDEIDDKLADMRRRLAADGQG